MLRKTLELNKHRSRCLDSPRHEEFQYLNLLDDIISNGHLENGRNGKTLCVVGAALHFSLEHNVIPILTTKKTAWKTCLKELLWFIKGQTSNDILNKQNVHIWDGNNSKSFKDSCGLGHYNDADLGPIYGYQWRFFNAPYNDCNTDYTGKGHDQLADVIHCLKDPSLRNSRRLVISAWNPSQIKDAVLPPCHVLFQFVVTQGDKLSCSLYQRSCDCALGQPFNIASYSFLTHLIAKHCDLQPYEFIHNIGNAHIYEPHIQNIQQQIHREPYQFPTVEISSKKDNINDYTIDDFILQNYISHKPIIMKMVP